MTATIFVDTNVLVYRRDAGQGDKQKQADAWGWSDSGQIAADV